MQLNMPRRGCCEQTFTDLRLHAWCGKGSLLPCTGAEVEDIIVSYEVWMQNEWTSSSFSPGGKHHFLTERFDTNFAISQEQSVPVATQRSAFLCQYVVWGAPLPLAVLLPPLFGMDNIVINDPRHLALVAFGCISVQDHLLILQPCFRQRYPFDFANGAWPQRSSLRHLWVRAVQD